MKRRILGIFAVLSAGLGWMLLTAPAAYAAPGQGGFEGKVTVDYGTHPQNCMQTSLAFDGPTKKSVNTGPLGGYDTGLTLDPGEYTITGTCKQPGQEDFAISVKGTVQADKLTKLDIKAVNPAQEPVEIPKDPPPNCNAGKGWDWIICGGIRTMVDFIDWVRDEVIVPFLEERPMDKDAADVKPVYDIWEQFRNIASLFFILIFFLVIIGTAIGWDNYTVKKALPRLVMGAILLPFSWYFCVAVVDIGNILGHGLVSLSATLIPPADINFTSGWSKLLLTGLLVGGVAAAAGAIAMVGWGIVISMALAILGVFLTLVIRKLLITLLIIISPFAFIVWILPNTSKWFKVWAENFVKLVMMFPLVMMLFEAGRLFALAAGAFTGNTMETTVRPLLQMAGYIIPLFAIPMTFSWAGKGLALGQKAATKATGFVDKRYGNKSDWAKDRKHTREAVNSMKAVDFSKKGFGAAVKRGVAAKRSGQAGFFAHASLGTKKDAEGKPTGLRKIPLLGADEATRNRLHKTAQHAVDEEAASEAIDHMRHEQPQSSADRMRNIQAAAYNKLFEQRRVEEMLATKNRQGVSVKDIPVTSATTDDVTKAKDAYEQAIKTGDKKAIKKANLRMVDALQNSTGGMDQMEGMLREEVNKGDGANKARVAAILTRLGSSQSGVDRAVALGSGFVKEKKDATGRVIGYEGGNGMNADGSAAVLGGDDNSMTGNKWASTWSSGMAKATGLDINKSLSAAVSDLSADQVAKSSAPQMRRVMGYVSRNLEPGGDTERALAARDTLNDAAKAVLESNPMKAKILVDTRNVIANASEMETPIIAPEIGVKYRNMISEPAPPPAVPELVAQQIIQATDHDAVHSAQIHQQITQEMTGNDLRSSETYRKIEDHVLSEGPLQSGDLGRLGAQATPMPLPDGHVAPAPAVSQRMAEEFKDNLDALAAAQQHFAVNETYRNRVDSAFQRGVKIPPAPGASAPSAGGPNPGNPGPNPGGPRPNPGPTSPAGPPPGNPRPTPYQSSYDRANAYDETPGAMTDYHLLMGQNADGTPRDNPNDPNSPNYNP